MNKHIYIIVSLFIAFAIFLAPQASADTSNGGYGSVNCESSYGGGKNCKEGNLSINKTVANPKTGDMVDNLSVNDPKYGPDSVVTFQLTVKNNSTVDVDKATVKDTFPQFVSFNSGAGNFDKNSKTLSFEIQNLKAGESRSFTVTGKTASVSQLPVSQKVTCVTNQSSVTAKDMSGDEDNAGFCIEKEVVTTKGGLTVYPAPKLTSTPATGVPFIPMAMLMPGAIIGYFINKKAKLK